MGMHKNSHVHMWRPMRAFFLQSPLGGSWVHAGLRPTRSTLEVARSWELEDLPKLSSPQSIPTQPSSSRTKHPTPQLMTGRSPTPQTDEPTPGGVKRTVPNLARSTGAQPRREPTRAGSSAVALPATGKLQWGKGLSHFTPCLNEARAHTHTGEPQSRDRQTSGGPDAER